MVLPSACISASTATEPAQYAYVLVLAQHARPGGLVVVVPITCWSCNDIDAGCAFRGDRAPDLKFDGEPVGVERRVGV